MHEPRFTQTDLNRHSGLVIAEASRQPVIITVRNKPTIAILSVEDYDRMIDFAKHRWATCPEKIPAYIRADAMAALAREPSESSEAQM